MHTQLAQNVVSRQRLLHYGILLLPSDNLGVSKIDQKKNPIADPVTNISLNLPPYLLGLVR